MKSKDEKAKNGNSVSENETFLALENDRLRLRLQEAEELLTKKENERIAELDKANQYIKHLEEVEKKLGQSERVLSHFLDEAPVGVIRWSAAGPITYANDHFLRMIGYSREDLISGNIDWTKLTLPEYEERDKEAFEEFYSTGRCFPYEKAYFRKDGSILPILISSVQVDSETEEGIGFVIDLTEIKEKQQKLRENEAMIENAQNLARIGSWEFDFISSRVKWSASLFQIFNQDPETFEPSLEGLYSFIHPDDLPLLKKTISDSIEKLRSYNHSYRIIINNQVKYIQTIAQVISDSKGNPLRMIGSSQDITESKLREKALKESEQRIKLLFDELRESERRYREMVKYAATAIYEIDFLNNKFVSVNDTMIQLLGYSKEELLEMNPFDILDPPSQLLYKERVLSGIRGKKPQDKVEYKIITKNGGHLDVLLNTSFIYDDDKITGAFVVGHDITERKKIEREIEESRKEAERQKTKIEALLRTSSSAIIIMESPDGRISFSNEKAKELYGTDPANLSIPDHPKLGILKLDRTPYTADEMPASRSMLKGEVITGEELIISRSDGSEVIVNVNTSPLYDSDGNIEAILGIFDDITYKKKAEEELTLARINAEAQRNRLIAFLQISPLGIIIIEKEGEVFSFINEAAKKMMGADYSGTKRSELKEISFLHPDGSLMQYNDLPTYKSLYFGETVSGQEVIISRKDGIKFPVLVYSTPFHNSNNEIEAVIVKFQDLSASKEDKKKIEYQAYLLSNISDAIIASDKDFRITFWNKGAERSYGYTEAEAVGKNGPELLGTSFAEYSYDEGIKLGAEKGRMEAEVIQRHKNGNYIHFHSAFSVLKDKEGNITDYVAVNRDLTERNKFIRDIRESEAKLQAALDSMTDAIFISDTEGNFIHFNDAFATFHRFSNKSECARTFKEYPDFLDVFFPDGTLAPVEMWAVPRALRGERITNAEYKLHRRDTGDIWIGSYSFGPVHDNEGKIVGSVVVARDVTELKQMEEELRESEERYSSLFYNSPSAIILTTVPENKVAMINDAFIRLFEHHEEEIIGMDAALLPIASQQEREVIIDRLDKQGFLSDFQSTGLTKSGKKIDLLLTINRVSIGGKKYSMTTITDVTERKRMEQAIRERDKENALLANIIEASSQAIAFSSLQGNIIYANKAMEELTGYSRDELNGMSWNQSLTAPENREIESVIKDDILKTGHPARYEKYYIRKDGTRVPVEILLNTKKDEKGRPQFFFAFINDITERKISEESLHKMIRTLRAMQRSSQIMIHAKDEQKFLQDVCRIIIEDCGHKMVWIGYKQNDENRSILPVASSGFEDNYLSLLNLTWDDTERGRGPSGIAVRTGKIAMCRDMINDPAFLPWREEALKRDYRSSIVFPLIMHEEVFGILSIYSREPDAFTMEEQQLLTRLAEDLSYGISAIRLNIALKQSKQDLEYKVEERTALLQKTMHYLDLERQRFQDVLNMIPAYVILLSPDQKILFANRIFRDIFGDIDLRSCKQHPDGKGKGCEICSVSSIVETHQPKFWEWEAHNDKVYQVSDFPFIDNDNTNLILEMGIDITEKKNIQKYVLSKILETEERDRRRFASDLHDDLGPTLSAIKLQLSMLSMEDTQEGKTEVLNVCDLLLSEGIEKMRTLANNIMPSLIESYGLETSVKSFINRMQKSGQIKFNFSSNLSSFRFDPETELHLYRIITELINNTIKHSGATEVNVDLKKTDSMLSISYSDNGIGYDINQSPIETEGIGLQNIQNRINLIGGEIEFSNKFGKTIVKINKAIGS